MSDRMRAIPFDKLLKWVFTEYKQTGTILGISDKKFYNKENNKDITIFSERLGLPLGPAAGPNTQLAQNIVTSYITGSRFFELKTVQILDELEIAKPCIIATDECYNSEWSTELAIMSAFEEYVKGWFLLHILQKELFNIDNKDFIFNMSVGYDLEGIQSPKVDEFIESMKDASNSDIFKECKAVLEAELPNLKNADKEYIDSISSKICNSITLSTLHGCPPDEIERISKYLLKEKNLTTYVKCNPTLLGYDFARKTLDEMGYDYISFDDHHFKEDLQFDDAIAMITRLKYFAKNLNLDFGVKLTNTFPVEVTRGELPSEEMYMAGRSLYPLSINLAYKLAKAFDGDLKISFSGGADALNIDKIFETGIYPITLATTILKPGGYSRLKQLAELLDPMIEKVATDRIDLEKLEILAKNSISDKNHLKEKKVVESRTIAKKVPLIDCFIAPCKVGCPIGQDIPEYIRLIGEGRYNEAYELIVSKNPLPFITGEICAHHCMFKCTRTDYDESVLIRGMKKVAAEKGFDSFINKLQKQEIKSDSKVAIIGAGPAGISAAYFLSLAGIQVTVFDKRDKIGGTVEHIIPQFRISREYIENDIQLVKKLGVKFELGVDSNFSVDKLKKDGYKYVFIGIGASKPSYLNLEKSDKEAINVIHFLEKFNKEKGKLDLGKNVAIIGGGNSAMDAARSSKQIAGVENVYLVYRRTKDYMPADHEEIELAMEDGVEFKVLLSPISLENGVLKCQKMKLGEPDESGRKRPVTIEGQFEEINVDTLIGAIGEKIDDEILSKNGINLNGSGKPDCNMENCETNIDNVYIGGDGLRGPATIVEAIADGRKAADDIITKEKVYLPKICGEIKFDAKKQLNEIIDKKALVQNACGLDNEKNRCLECNYICNICNEVCPNRANVSIKVSGFENINQVVHIDGMCNECGNCEVFCPYDSAPYKHKLTLFWTEEDFNDSPHSGFTGFVLIEDSNEPVFKIRLDGNVQDIKFTSDGKCDGNIPSDLAKVIWIMFKDYNYMFV